MAFEPISARGLRCCFPMALILLTIFDVSNQIGVSIWSTQGVLGISTRGLSLPSLLLRASSQSPFFGSFLRKRTSGIMSKQVGDEQLRR